MAKNFYDDDALKVFIGILVVACVIAIFLVKWAIIGVVLLIVCVVKDSYKTLPTKPVEVITKKELKQVLKISDIDIYDNVFEPKIKPRGQKHYAENKIKSVEHNGNRWNCKVEGTQEYETSITFDNENISKTNCTCPYYQKDHKNCKHIYALLIKAKCENNIPIIMQAITDYSNSLTKIVNKEIEYVNNNISNIPRNTAISIVNSVDNFQNKMSIAKENIKEYSRNEEVLLDILIELIEYSYAFSKNFESLINEVESSKNTNNTNNTYNPLEDENRIKLKDIIVGTMIMNEIDKYIHKK